MTKKFDTAPENDFDLWAFFIDVDHKFTDRTSIVLSAKRDVNETNWFGTSYFTTTGVSGEFRHEFGYRLSGLARFSYGKDVFSNAVPPETVVREDTTLREGIGVRYTVSTWLNIGADYDLQRRDSNIDANDYRNHLYTLSLRLTF